MAIPSRNTIGSADDDNNAVLSPPRSVRVRVAVVVVLVVDAVRRRVVGVVEGFLRGAVPVRRMGDDAFVVQLLRSERVLFRSSSSSSSVSQAVSESSFTIPDDDEAIAAGNTLVRTNSLNVMDCNSSNVGV